MKTYEEMAQQVSELSNTIYTLSYELGEYYEKNMVPGERPLNTCYLAKEILRNMCYTLETLGDTMLGN